MKNLKNLLIHINPNKKFTDGWGDEIEKLVKIQIDNSLEMGWERRDMMLVTNFPYEYNGVSSLVIGDENYCEISPTASKINTIVTLFERGLDDNLYWFHDFDAFQLEPLDVDIHNQVGMTDYGVTVVGRDVDRRWSTGVIFFRNDTRDVFEWIKDAVYKYQTNEEIALLAMCRHNKHGINEKIKKLNVTYNFATRKRNVNEQLKITEMPLRTVHFHPWDKRPVFYTKQKYNNIDVCVLGKNDMGKPLITERLLKIFKQHEII